MIGPRPFGSLGSLAPLAPLVAAVLANSGCGFGCREFFELDLRDADSGQLIWSRPGAAFVSAVSADGSTFLSFTTRPLGITVYRLSDGDIIERFSLPPTCPAELPATYQVAAGTAGPLLVAANAEWAIVPYFCFSSDPRSHSEVRRCAIWNLRSRQRAYLMEKDSCIPLHIAQDGLALMRVDDGVVRWDPRSGEALPSPLSLQMVGGDVYPNSTFSRDNSLLAAGFANGSIIVWQTNTGAVMSELQVAPGSLRHLAWSPSGTRLLTRTTLFEIPSGRALRQASEEVVWTGEFLPDSRRYVESRQMGCGGK